VRRLIVDGYNVVHAWPRLRQALDASGLEDARRLLIRAMAGYSPLAAVDVTVVFDAHGRSGGQDVEVVDGVTVRFGSRQASADHVIERLAYEAAQEGTGIDVVVATNDRLTRDVVGAMGVPTMSAAALEADVERVAAEALPAGRRSGGAAPGRLEDHLSAEVRDRLDAIRRGSTAEASSEEGGSR
jgi:predicted RNA-binding protein with PIN domain